ncbi:isochorismate synthase DhbC [Curvibacter sp. CHRR-16]|uniref:isochorismate synthase DhbC n=1 Tax=Curvibacter sp. CHRR-16 TaxID=2835872 RepID=UPI001BDA680F|nr:isochorismate synthase DhbC [Curvibacter sp. CHRR-16]MBT0570238.1 isochorismate synthase DhbC [Curvibacter sp. CHRR-16]
MNDIFKGMITAQAKKLLAAYSGDEPFFFATPQRTLLAQGHYANIPWAPDLKTMAIQVQAALQEARSKGHPYPIAVGCIPFDLRQPMQLSIPHQVVLAGGLGTVTAPSKRAINQYELVAVPSRQDYAAAVAKAVARIQSGALSKVVLSRTLEIQTQHSIDVPAVLSHLASKNQHGYTFAVKLYHEGGVLVGATPELLVHKDGLQVRSNPLAGSAARSGNAQEDAQRSAALQQSAKDLHEHQVVADAVAQAMQRYCKTLHAPQIPSVISTATMWHLSSDIRGELDSPDTHCLEVAGALHPTPAICGHPTVKARELIRELEPFNRAYFTGMVGWCDEFGNGEWALTLRCAEIKDKQVRLYAGAGIVGDSDPDSEAAETGAKFRTMLHALGLPAGEDSYV